MTRPARVGPTLGAGTDRLGGNPADQRFPAHRWFPLTSGSRLTSARSARRQAEAAATQRSSTCWAAPESMAAVAFSRPAASRSVSDPSSAS